MAHKPSGPTPSRRIDPPTSYEMNVSGLGESPSRKGVLQLGAFCGTLVRLFVVAATRDTFRSHTIDLHRRRQRPRTEFPVRLVAHVVFLHRETVATHEVLAFRNQVKAHCRRSVGGRSW